MPKLYLIGSLRNPRIPEVASQLRSIGFDVFDDWFAAGPEADDYWQKYEKERGHDLPAALDGIAANHVYSHDRYHLDDSDVAVLRPILARLDALMAGAPKGVSSN